MRRKSCIVLLGLLILASILNIVAWLSSSFCDFYVLYLHPFMINTYGRLTGFLPFSVGEVMIVIFIALTLFALLLFLCIVFLLLFFRKYTVWKVIKKFAKSYYFGYAWGFTVVFFIMTLNSFIPFHCSSLDDKYDLFSVLPEETDILQDLLKEDYSLEELSRIRNFVVLKTNTLAQMVERDEQGNIIYPDNMEDLAAESMQNIAKGCPQLKGYYPAPKQIKFSGFLSQQHMKGYFFPFSMEANYNGLMHKINRPATICHEYAHLKGFMYEDEANLIGFLACVNSTDITFQYSGYLSILNYINNEYYEAIGKNKAIYEANVKISSQVMRENVFLEEDTWLQVEEKAILSTQVVDKVSDKFTETTLTINGIEDGMLSYNRVVGLLIKYYAGSKEVENTLMDQEYLVQSK